MNKLCLYYTSQALHYASHAYHLLQYASETTETIWQANNIQDAEMTYETLVSYHSSSWIYFFWGSNCYREVGNV